MVVFNYEYSQVDPWFCIDHGSKLDLCDVLIMVVKHRLNNEYRAMSNHGLIMFTKYELLTMV